MFSTQAIWSQFHAQRIKGNVFGAVNITALWCGKLETEKKNARRFLTQKSISSVSFFATPMSLEIENPGKILGKAFIMLQRGSTFAITFCKALKEKMVNLVLTLLFRKQFKKRRGKLVSALLQLCVSRGPK